jgi:hypothetical protein
MVLQLGGWARGYHLTVKKKLVMKFLLRASGLAVSCEHGNEPSDSIKGGGGDLLPS